MEALLAWCLIPGIYLAYTDWKKRLLYDYVTIPMFIIGLFFSIFIFKNPTTALLGFAVAFGMMFLMALRGGVGGGDVKLSGALGIWFGFPDILYVLLIGSLLSFIYGSYVLIKKGKWKEKMQPFFTSVMIKLLYDKSGKIYTEKLPEEGIAENAVPFGTFLIIGAWIWFLLQVLQVL